MTEKSPRQFALDCTDGDLLAVIRSTNPDGAKSEFRLAAMDEWDRRYPVASHLVANREAE